MQMTGRAWWLAITALLSLTVGILAENGFLRIFGASWFALLFGFFLYGRVTLGAYKNRLSFRPSFEPAAVARQGEDLKLQIEGFALVPGGLWMASIEPIVTGRLEKPNGEKPRWERDEESGSWHLRQTYRPTHPGEVRLLGMRVRLVDSFGWFESFWHIGCPLKIPVCPARIASQRRGRGGKKKANSLWKPGLFQYDRSGQSLEFFGLREWIPGDSQRRIAWKQSLRRDQMLVRETEWEVPLTINCLVDAGPANRYRGTTQSSIFDQMIPLVMTTLQNALEGHNPIGLSLVDPGNEEFLAPGVGKIHMTKCELALARKSGRIPPQVDAPPDSLIAQAEPILQALFPAELDPATNNLPLWNSWVEGFPAWTPHPTWRRKLDTRRWWFWLVGPLGWAGLPVVFALTEKERRLSHARKRIATLLCASQGLAPGALERLLQDDLYFSGKLTDFLAQLGLEVGIPDHGFANDARLQTTVGHHLAGTLRRKLAYARDHQVFLLFVSSQTLIMGMGPLLESLRRAISLGHKVWVIDLNPDTSASTSWAGAYKDLHRILGKIGVSTLEGNLKDLKNHWETRLEKEGFLGKR